MENKFSLCAFADEADQSLDGQIKALSENKINMIELRGVDGVNVANLTPEKAKDTSDRLLDAGIAVWSLGSPAGKSDIHKDFEFEREQFKRLLEIADITNAECIRIFSFYGTNCDISGTNCDKSERDEVLERLDRFVEMAKGSRVFLCHENEKGIYGDNAERCLDICKNIPEIKAVFDPANFVQCGQDTKAAWDMLEKYVFYCHIKDALPDGQVVPPGDGQGNLLYILEKYRKIGEVLTVEPHLSEFVGLKGLEIPGERSMVGGNHFENNRAAFDYAVNKLKNLIDGL